MKAGPFEIVRVSGGWRVDLDTVDLNMAGFMKYLADRDITWEIRRSRGQCMMVRYTCPLFGNLRTMIQDWWKE
jgi:hypothetical protein